MFAHLSYWYRCSAFQGLGDRAAFARIARGSLRKKPASSAYAIAPGARQLSSQGVATAQFLYGLAVLSSFSIRTYWC